MDLDGLRLQNTKTSLKQKASLKPNPDTVGGFIKGPIPLLWISKAAEFKGSELHVALALWYLAGLTKSKTVKLTRKARETHFHVKRDAVYRALENLEQAGLVRVERQRGRLPIVAIIDFNSAHGGDDFIEDKPILKGCKSAQTVIFPANTTSI